MVRALSLIFRSRRHVDAMHPGNSLVKYADDTYLVVPSANISTRALEINNVEVWAAANNLKLNVSKMREIVFQNPRRRIVVTLPLPLPGISRENSSQNPWGDYYKPLVGV